MQDSMLPQPISLKKIMLEPAQPMVSYELISPRTEVPEELESQIALVREIAGSVHAINVPEIRTESRPGDQRKRFPERIEPRIFAQQIQAAAPVAAVVNRITVRQPWEAQRQWLREAYQQFGIRHLILVGAESHRTQHPGPSVSEMADMVSQEGLELLLGGITIPSRSREVERIRQKYEHGLRFFSSQVLLDSNDIVDLIQGLNGLDVRIFLSFAPIYSLRDLEFMRWLGVDIPQNIPWTIAQSDASGAAAERSIALALKILTDVFDNLPAHPPALGINVESVIRRNLALSRRMLQEVGDFYRQLVQARYTPAAAHRAIAPASGPPQSHSQQQ